MVESTQPMTDSEEEICKTGYMSYPSIKLFKPNLLKKFCNLNYVKMKPEDPVYITEKIHGTNFQMTLNVDDQTIYLGKRNSEICKPFPRNIDPQELIKKYYQYQTESFFPGAVMFVISTQLKKANELYEVILAKNPDSKEIILFGELFGGYYEDEEADKKQEEQKQEQQTSFPRIQLEIQYSKEPHFWIFDIVIDRKYTTSGQFFEYCKAVNFPTVPLINTLRYDQVFDLVNQKLIFKYEDYVTNVPKILGQTNIKADNTAEGVVLKFGKKVIKIKSEKFYEDCKKPKPKNVQKKVEKKSNKLQEVHKRMNFNRIQSVMIKEGNQQEVDKAYELTMQDIRKDLKEDDLFDEELEKEITQYQKQLKQKFDGMFKNYMKQLDKK